MFFYLQVPAGSQQVGWEEGVPQTIVVNSLKLSKTLRNSDSALSAAYVELTDVVSST